MTIPDNAYVVNWRLTDVGPMSIHPTVDAGPRHSYRTIPTNSGFLQVVISFKSSGVDDATVSLQYAAPSDNTFTVLSTFTVPGGETNYQSIETPTIVGHLEKGGILALIDVSTSGTLPSCIQFEFQCWLQPAVGGLDLIYDGDVLGGTPETADSAVPCGSNPYYRKLLNRFTHLYDKSVASTMYSLKPYEFSGHARPNDTLQIWYQDNPGKEAHLERVQINTTGTMSYTVTVQPDGTFLFWKTLIKGKNILYAKGTDDVVTSNCYVNTYNVHLWLCAYAQEINEWIAGERDAIEQDGHIASGTTPRGDALRDIWQQYVGLSRPSWMTDTEYQTYLYTLLNSAFKYSTHIKGIKDAIEALTGTAPDVFEDYLYNRGMYVGESYVCTDGQLTPDKYHYFVAAMDLAGNVSPWEVSKVLTIDKSILVIENDLNYVDDRQINIINFGTHVPVDTDIYGYRVYRAQGDIDLTDPDIYSSFEWLRIPTTDDLPNPLVSGLPVVQTFFDRGTITPYPLVNPEPGGTGPAGPTLTARSRTKFRAAQAMNHYFTVQINFDALYAQMLSLAQLTEARLLCRDLIRIVKRLSHKERISYTGVAGGYETGTESGLVSDVEHDVVAHYPIVQFASIVGSTLTSFMPNIVDFVSETEFFVTKLGSGAYTWALIGGQEHVYTKRYVITMALPAGVGVATTITHTTGVIMPLFQIVAPGGVATWPTQVEYLSTIQTKFTMTVLAPGSYTFILMGGDPATLFNVHNDLKSGTSFTVTHNLGYQYPLVQIMDAADQLVHPTGINFLSANTLSMTTATGLPVRVVCIG